MERSPICPSCLSKYPDIRGQVYPSGDHIGDRCVDTWHKGAEYDPNKWDLSPSDEEFLAEQHISLR